MKFIGSIPSNSRAVFYNLIKHLPKDTNFLIGTSGSFTIESILLASGFKNIYSNDISLLSYSYGKGAIGEKVEIQLVNEFFCELKEFENKSIEDNLGIILTLYQASEYCTFSPYQKKHYFDVLKKGILEAFRKNREKAESTLKNLKIKGFIGKDFCEILEDEELCRDKIIVASIPTYSGGYEKIYKFLNESIVWRNIPYTCIDKNNYEDINQAIVDRGGIAFLDRESSVTNLKGVSKGMGKPIYIHSKIGEDKFFIKNKDSDKFYRASVFDGDFKSVEKVEVRLLKSTTFNRLREKFISIRNTNLGAVDLPFGVYLDGEIVGLIGVEIPTLKFGEPNILLKTDMSFVNRNRVSKLIPMLASCKEMVGLIESAKKRRVRYNVLYTVVFTSNAQSMKYRGVGECISRDKEKGKLVYIIKKTDLSFKEVYNLWLKKHYRD